MPDITECNTLRLSLYEISEQAELIYSEKNGFVLPGAEGGGDWLGRGMSDGNVLYLDWGGGNMVYT